MASDPVNHPSHYADGWSNGAQVIDITENLNFNRGNAVKYLCRAGRKSADTEREDLEKAYWYLTRELDRTRGDGMVLAGRQKQSLIQFEDAIGTLEDANWFARVGDVIVDAEERVWMHSEDSERVRFWQAASFKSGGIDIEFPVEYYAYAPAARAD